MIASRRRLLRKRGQCHYSRQQPTLTVFIRAIQGLIFDSCSPLVSAVPPSGAGTTLGIPKATLTHTLARLCSMFFSVSLYTLPVQQYAHFIIIWSVPFLLHHSRVSLSSYINQSSSPCCTPLDRSIVFSEKKTLEAMDIDKEEQELSLLVLCHDIIIDGVTLRIFFDNILTPSTS